MSGAAIRPADTADLVDLVRQATAQGIALEFFAGGTKRSVARPDRDVRPAHLGAFAGIIDYEPSELVLTVRPATPLAEVQTLLAANGQMLAFEPWDAGCLFGESEACSTIGGVVVAGIAGPRRLTAGGARDHLLGFHAVSGRGEAFKAGGKVVKNVTGYDLSKLIAGSWGQLAIMTELSLKVLPAPRSSATVIVEGLTADAAVRAMSAALGSRTSPVSAAYLPATGAERSRTCLRIEGFAESVKVRGQQLIELLATFGSAEIFAAEDAASLWSEVKVAAKLRSSELLWRAHVSPSRSAALAEALDRAGAEWFLDWAGGLVWIGASAAQEVRSIVSAHGGHAMLMRAPAQVRQSVPIRQPDAPALAALSSRVKQAFDPSGVLDPQRFG